MIVTVTTVEDYIQWSSLFDTRVYTMKITPIDIRTHIYNTN
jgi:hypothetical protein